MTADEWIERYATALGVPVPTEDEVAQLLALAGVAAHASQRTAAPVTTWLAARAGRPPEDALAVAQRLAGEVEPGGA